MMIIGVDYHPGFQQIAFGDPDTGEDRQLRGDDSERGFQCRQAAAGAYQQAGQFVVALLAGGGGPSGGPHQLGVERSLHPPVDAEAQEHCQGGAGRKAGDSIVLDVAAWL